MTDTRISDFSRRFSAALQGVMREHRLAVDDVADKAGRSRGFVSEHTSGKKAPDTDLMDAVARAIGYDTNALLGEIHERLRRAPVDIPSSKEVSATIDALDRELERQRTKRALSSDPADTKRRAR
jgi:hypothetical protein